MWPPTYSAPPQPLCPPCWISACAASASLRPGALEHVEGQGQGATHKTKRFGGRQSQSEEPATVLAAKIFLEDAGVRKD